MQLEKGNEMKKETKCPWKCTKCGRDTGGLFRVRGRKKAERIVLCSTCDRNYRG